MDLLQSADDAAVPSKPLTEALSAQESLRFEPMAEYKSTQDDTDLARFGKRQQLNVSIVVFSAPSVRAVGTKVAFRRETLVFGQL